MVFILMFSFLCFQPEDAGPCYANITELRDSASSIPSSEPPHPAEDESSSLDLGDGWGIYRDPQTNKQYYHNKVSSTSEKFCLKIFFVQYKRIRSGKNVTQVFSIRSYVRFNCFCVNLLRIWKKLSLYLLEAVSCHTLRWVMWDKQQVGMSRLMMNHLHLTLGIEGGYTEILLQMSNTSIIKFYK